MNTIEKDNEIDPKNVMQKIRDNLKKRNISTGDIIQTNEDDFNYINSNWDLNVDYRISSHRSPIIARLLITGRNLIHGEVRRYVSLIAGKQAEFNVCISRILTVLIKNVTNINDTIILINKDIDTKIGEMTKSVNKDIDTKIGDMTKSANKDIDHHKNVDVNKWCEFYKEDTTEDWLKKNIEYHTYFISIINKYSVQLSQGNIPKLVEIGTGTATMSIYFSRTSYDVLGIDNDPIIVSKAINANKKLGGYAKFICLDAFDLQKLFKEKLFDVAFSQGTLEHFNNDNLKRFIDAQLYVAKCVIFSVPSINYPNSEFGNERKMSVDEWNILLKSFGYNIDYISYYQEEESHVVAVILS